MDAFATLEKKVVKLIEAYEALRARVSELEEENASLRDAAGDGDGDTRIAALEGEREELRARLTKLAEKLDSIEL